MQSKIWQKVKNVVKRGNPHFSWLVMSPSNAVYKGRFGGGKRVNSKDFYLSFRCTNPTHPGCVKDVSLTQAQFPPGSLTSPHLPTTRRCSLKQRLNKVSWQHQQLLGQRRWLQWVLSAAGPWQGPHQELQRPSKKQPLEQTQAVLRGD